MINNGILRVANRTWKWIIAGLVAFPMLAVITGVAFRFPIPFGGYRSGASYAFDYFLASLFYGLFFGIIPISMVVCAVVGHVTLRGQASDNVRVLRFLSVTLLLPVVACAVLATLDYVIGPW